MGEYEVLKRWLFINGRGPQLRVQCTMYLLHVLKADLACSMEAMWMPPLGPILHAFKTRAVTEVLNCKEHNRVM